MNAPITTEIRRHLRTFLAGKQSRSDFRTWFAPVLWNIEEYADPEAEALAYDIELAFAEEASGAWAPARLRKELQRLMAHGFASK